LSFFPSVKLELEILKREREKEREAAGVERKTKETGKEKAVKSLQRRKKKTPLLTAPTKTAICSRSALLLGLRQQPRPLGLGHLLQPLGHHGLLVLLQLLGVAHVLAGDPPQIRAHPPETQKAKDDQLHIVSRHALLDSQGLEAVVHAVAEGEDPGADEEDVLAGVAELDLEKRRRLRRCCC
jgi:hypothetical protein